jgi:nucleotide-binding universal stress UspA family protein
MKKNIKILVPVDFTPCSRETLEFALSLRQFFDPSYLLLHVVPTGEVESFATLGAEPEQGRDRRIEESSTELEREARRLREEIPGLSLECRVAAGLPFREICRIAEEEKAQLVVIGTHGRTGISHLLTGSTAERVVQHASCPVLSIKARG